VTPSAAALPKRIKRRLVGRPQRFYAATAPGLETLCREELARLLPAAAQIALEAGGVEFEGRLPDCYRANLNLRTAGRILMRIGSFHAANFRQLEQNLVQIPWELYLEPGRKIRVQAAAHRSRLYHSDAIAARIEAAVALRLKRHGRPGEAAPPAGVVQQIFARALQNEFTLSIDSSGELLYKRGLKTFAAKAPLRETLAAAALMLAGYSGAEPLIDPMCGSGSFSLEAALMARRIPPGWYREFAFMSWPSFRPGRWREIRRRAEAEMSAGDAAAVFASDRDAQAVDDLKATLARCGLTGAVDAAVRDFFEFSPQQLTARKGVVALNPPFGLRIGSRPASDRLLTDACRRLQSEYRGWKFALVVPRAYLIDAVPFRSAVHILPHGGIRIALLTGKIP